MRRLNSFRWGRTSLSSPGRALRTTGAASVATLHLRDDAFATRKDAPKGGVTALLVWALIVVSMLAIATPKEQSEYKPLRQLPHPITEGWASSYQANLRRPKLRPEALCTAHARAHCCKLHELRLAATRPPRDILSPPRHSLAQLQSARPQDLLGRRQRLRVTRDLCQPRLAPATSHSPSLTAWRWMRLQAMKRTTTMQQETSSPLCLRSWAPRRSAPDFSIRSASWSPGKSSWRARNEQSKTRRRSYLSSEQIWFSYKQGRALPKVGGAQRLAAR